MVTQWPHPLTVDLNHNFCLPSYMYLVDENDQLYCLDHVALCALSTYLQTEGRMKNACVSRKGNSAVQLDPDESFTKL